MDGDSLNSYSNVKKERDLFNEIEIHYSKRKEKKWYHDVADFANLLKSFIGTNYLSLAYGISLSGLGLGIGGLILVAVLTAHCCRLIIKVKYHVIQQVIQKRRPLTTSGANSYSSNEEKAMFKRLQRRMTYSDVGSMAYGKWGGRVVLIFLVITQIGFCVSYHIFIGSNIYNMIAPNRVNETLGNCTHVGLAVDLQGANIYLGGAEFAEPLPGNVNSLQITTMSNNLSTSTIGTTSRSTLTDIPSTHAPISNFTVSPPSNITQWIPSLALFVALPLPLFIAFTLFRNVRLMGFISLVANGMMSAGYIVVIAYIFATFKLADNLEWFKWTTFPVFLGQATSSYEAIGTLLSIEASMDGNHHRYPTCLYSVIGVFSAMLSISAVLGYLRYGENTAQILVQNLPQSGALFVAVNVVLIIAILFTYPLQVYPVIEILEGALFAEGGCCGPSRRKLSSKTSNVSLVTDETQPLLDSSRGEDVEKCKEGLVVKVIPESVATWKRNLFRISIAVLIAGLAVTFRGAFAYINAFVGAIGSCPLAFILPCLFHLKLCWPQLSRTIIIKDIVVLIVGLVIGVISLAVVVWQLVVGMTSSGHATVTLHCVA